MGILKNAVTFERGASENRDPPEAASGHFTFLNPV